MTSNPSSLTDLKGQVAMSITLGMVLDDGTKESTGGGMMSNNALLGGDEGEEGMLCFLCVSFLCLSSHTHTLVVRSKSYNAPFALSSMAINLPSPIRESPLSPADVIFFYVTSCLLSLVISSAIIVPITFAYI